MSIGPPLKKLKQSMLSFTIPGVKMSEGLPKKLLQMQIQGKRHSLVLKKCNKAQSWVIGHA